MSVSPYPWEFTVKPTRSGRYYYDVFVDETRDEMASRIRSKYPVSDGLTATDRRNAVTLAMVMSAFDINDQWYLGSIFFSDEHMGAGIVAHEMTHAALRYIENKGVHLRHWQYDTSEPHEEFLCDAVGHLNRQFWLRFNDRYFGEGALV